MDMNVIRIPPPFLVTETKYFPLLQPPSDWFYCQDLSPKSIKIQVALHLHRTDREGSAHTYRAAVEGEFFHDGQASNKLVPTLAKKRCSHPCPTSQVVNPTSNWTIYRIIQKILLPLQIDWAELSHFTISVGHRPHVHLVMHPTAKSTGSQYIPVIICGSSFSSNVNIY